MSVSAPSIVRSVLQNIYEYELNPKYFALAKKSDKKIEQLKKQGLDMVDVYKDKGVTHISNLLSYAANRLQDNKRLQEKLTFIYYTTIIPEHIRPLLSPMGTFFDRQTMYYEKSLHELSNLEFAYVIICEFFNGKQDYFSNYDDKHRRIVFSQTLSMMAHVGLYEGKIYYSKRDDVLYRMQLENPNHPILSKVFAPNEKAARYLFDEIMNFPDFAKLFAIMGDEVSTSQVREIYIRPIGYSIRKNGIDYYDTSNQFGFGREFTIYIMRDQFYKWIRIPKGHKKTREHSTAISVAKRFAEANGIMEATTKAI